MIIWAILLIALLYWLARSEAFRKFTLWVVLVGGGGLALIAWYSNEQADREYKAAQAKEAAANQEAWSAIAPRDVEVSDLTVVPSNYMPDLRGTIRNHSSRTIGQLNLRVRINRCPLLRPCEISSEAEVEVMSKVPPGQARDFDVMTDVKTPNGDDWSPQVEVIAIRAIPALGS